MFSEPLRVSAFSERVMTRSPIVSLVVLAVLPLGPNRLVAEERVEQNPARNATAVENPPTPSQPRLMSSTMAEHLAEAAPKFAPPAPGQVQPSEAQTDLRETDKPRNTI